MAYFSSKSTWLSLVEGASPQSITPDDFPLPLEDFSPCLPALSSLEEDMAAGEMGPAGPADHEHLRLTRDLRHRLFFHHREWEFGPGLFEDSLKLAQSQSHPKTALAHYEEVRRVAKALVEEFGQADFLPPLLETLRILAEIHQLMEDKEGCETRAKEGLETIRGHKFDASLDLRITKLAMRFFSLLGLR